MIARSNGCSGWAVETKWRGAGEVSVDASWGLSADAWARSGPSVLSPPGARRRIFAAVVRGKAFDAGRTLPHAEGFVRTVFASGWTELQLNCRWVKTVQNGCAS